MNRTRESDKPVPYGYAAAIPNASVLSLVMASLSSSRRSDHVYPVQRVATRVEEEEEETRRSLANRVRLHDILREALQMTDEMSALDVDCLDERV